MLQTFVAWLELLENEWLRNKWFRIGSITIGIALLDRISHLLYRKYRRLPPGPVGIPFIGSMVSFVSNQASFVLSQPKLYGDLSYFQLGKHNVILINNTKLMKQLLDNRALQYRPPLKHFFDAQHNVTFTNNLKQWQLRRGIGKNSWIIPLSTLKLNSLKMDSNNNIWYKLIDENVIRIFDQCINENNGLFDPNNVEYSLNQLFQHLAFNVSLFGMTNQHLAITDKHYQDMTNNINKTFELFDKILAINDMPFLR